MIPANPYDAGSIVFGGTIREVGFWDSFMEISYSLSLRQTESPRWSFQWAAINESRRRATNFSIRLIQGRLAHICSESGRRQFYRNLTKAPQIGDIAQELRQMTLK
jgi:hypothetical protein